MAEEMNPDNNPSLLNTVLNAIIRVETQGESVPYATKHDPVKLVIYGNDADVARQVKDFNKAGYVTSIINGKQHVHAQALGAYGILDIEFNTIVKAAAKKENIEGFGNYNWKEENWESQKVQDMAAKYLAEKYFDDYKSWDLVRVAWFGGPGRANKINNKTNTLEEMPQNIQDDLSKFKTYLNEEIDKAPPTTIGTSEVELDVDADRGIPDPVPGYVPNQFKMKEDFVASDINIPNQGPMGREEKMIAKLFSSLVPEANRGVLNKTPGSAREIR